MENKRVFRERWSDPAFERAKRRVVDAVFAEGGTADGVDLRGIVVGDGSPIGLHNVGLYKRTIRDSNFSFSEFECAFLQSVITDSVFEECDFDGANFSKVQISGSHFDRSILVSCSFNDARVRSTSFRAVRLSDRRELPCELLRAVFEGCDFGGAIFKNVECRAAKFIDCSFLGSTFEGCDMRGAKFIGQRPEAAQFIRCAT